MQSDNSGTIICDPGTGYMKMGFAGDNFPKASFASLVGRPMLRS
jgi:actin-related protein 2